MLRNFRRQRPRSILLAQRVLPSARRLGPGICKLGVSINPADVSAGILIFDTCFGTLTAHGPIDLHWGLGRHLIENLAIGATVTTWELTLLDARKLEKLVVDLESGMTLGRAVARFNRSEIARRTAARLAIFGDPETRAATRRELAAHPRVSTSPGQYRAQG